MLFTYEETTTYKPFNQDDFFEEEQDGDNTILKINLPGYNKDNVELHYLKNEKFVILYNKDKDTKNTMEIEVPNVDINTIEATMKDGLLKVKYKLKEVNSYKIKIKEQ